MTKNSWQETREKWNKENKCAREVCKASLFRRGFLAFGKHTGTGLKYCVVCTRLINEANPMPDGKPLVIWQERTVPNGIIFDDDNDE